MLSLCRRLLSGLALVFARAVDHYSLLLAIICGVAGVALGLFTEWRFAPFIADHSLSYFLSHLHLLRPITWIMLALGAFLSYRLALGRDRNTTAT
jgi:hypothetical protein